MERAIAWLREPVVQLRWMWLLTYLVLWGMIGRDAYDYLVYTRPMDKCYEAREHICQIGKTTVHIVYKGERP
jgi:hypothetical protein